MVWVVCFLKALPLTYRLLDHAQSLQPLEQLTVQLQRTKTLVTKSVSKNLSMTFAIGSANGRGRKLQMHRRHAMGPRNPRRKKSVHGRLKQPSGLVGLGSSLGRLIDVEERSCKGNPLLHCMPLVST